MRSVAGIRQVAAITATSSTPHTCFGSISPAVNRGLRNARPTPPSWRNGFYDLSPGSSNLKDEVGQQIEDQLQVSPHLGHSHSSLILFEGATARKAGVRLCRRRRCRYICKVLRASQNSSLLARLLCQENVIKSNTIGHPTFSRNLSRLLGSSSLGILIFTKGPRTLVWCIHTMVDGLQDCPRGPCKDNS